MSLKQWGNATWDLLHTLSLKLRGGTPVESIQDAYGQLRAIATNLPCPSCSQHATNELRRYPSHVDSVEGLARVFWSLHNRVNERLGKPQVSWVECLELYRHKSPLEAARRYLIVGGLGPSGSRDLGDQWRRGRVRESFIMYLRKNAYRYIR